MPCLTDDSLFGEWRMVYEYSLMVDGLTTDLYPKVFYTSLRIRPSLVFAFVWHLDDDNTLHMKT